MPKVVSLLSMLIICSLSAQPLLWQENGININQSRDFLYDGNFVQKDDGSFLTAWTEANDASHDIWAMFMDGNGEAIWDAPRKILDNDFRLNSPRFIRTSDDNLMLSALQIENVHQHAILIKMDWDGNMLWNEPIVFDNPNGWGCIKCKTLPDNNGGVYFFITDYAYQSSLSLVHRIGPDGEFLWDVSGIDMFDGQVSMSAGFNACPDGEGGFVACTIFSSRWSLEVQRLLPDGGSPWGNNGYIELGVRGGKSKKCTGNSSKISDGSKFAFCSTTG